MWGARGGREMSLGTFGSLAEKDVDGVSHIELGINGSDGGVQK